MERTTKLALASAVLLAMFPLARGEGKGTVAAWPADADAAKRFACHKSLLQFAYSYDESNVVEARLPARGRLVLVRTGEIDDESATATQDIVVIAGTQLVDGKKVAGFWVYLADGGHQFFPADGAPKILGPNGEKYFKVETPTAGPVFFSEFDDHNYGRQVTMAHTTATEFSINPPGYENRPDRSNKKAWKKYREASEGMFTPLKNAKAADESAFSSVVGEDFNSLLGSLCEQYRAYDDTDVANAGLGAVGRACAGVLGAKAGKNLAGIVKNRCKAVAEAKRFGAGAIPETKVDTDRTGPADRGAGDDDKRRATPIGDRKSQGRR